MPAVALADPITVPRKGVAVRLLTQNPGALGAGVNWLTAPLTPLFPASYLIIKAAVSAASVVRLRETPSGGVEQTLLMQGGSALTADVGYEWTIPTTAGTTYNLSADAAVNVTSLMIIEVEIVPS